MLPIGSVGMIADWAGGSRVGHNARSRLGASPYHHRGCLAIRLPLAQASLGCHLPLRSRAEVAQLVEQLIRNQQVTGSSPVFGSIHNLLTISLLLAVSSPGSSAFFFAAPLLSHLLAAPRRCRDARIAAASYPQWFAQAIRCHRSLLAASGNTICHCCVKGKRRRIPPA